MQELAKLMGKAAVVEFRDHMSKYIFALLVREILHVVKETSANIMSWNVWKTIYAVMLLNRGFHNHQTGCHWILCLVWFKHILFISHEKGLGRAQMLC